MRALEEAEGRTESVLADTSHPAPHPYPVRRRCLFQCLYPSRFRHLTPDPLPGLPWFPYPFRLHQVPRWALSTEQMAQAPAPVASAAASRPLSALPAEAAARRPLRHRVSGDSTG